MSVSTGLPLRRTANDAAASTSTAPAATANDRRDWRVSGGSGTAWDVFGSVCSQASISAVWAKTDLPPPATRWTGRPRSFSQRRTVATSRFRYAAIAFHESSRTLFPRVSSDIAPIFNECAQLRAVVDGPGWAGCRCSRA
jgi:hypothetical protein